MGVRFFFAYMCAQTSSVSCMQFLINLARRIRSNFLFHFYYQVLFVRSAGKTAVGRRLGLGTLGQTRG